MTTPLPFPELPYGAAPVWCFPLVELSIFALFLVCFRHAFLRGRRAMAYLLGGLLFGLLLEYFEVVTHSYTYGRFWLTIGRSPMDVPVWVGCAWGIIMYTARLFSDGVGLPLISSAALDTLLALNLDLSIDVVAYRLHMWHWYWNGTGLNPLRAQWFGIPYGNFIGWITVVFCYSAFSRGLERWVLRKGSSALRVILVAAASLACSLGVLVITETFVFPFVARFMGLTSGRRLILLSIILLALVVRRWPGKRGSREVTDPLAQWVPLWFHLVFVGFFIYFGFYRENRWMVVAALVNVLLGLAIHAVPVTRRDRGRTKEAGIAPAV